MELGVLAVASGLVLRGVIHRRTGAGAAVTVSAGTLAPLRLCPRSFADVSFVFRGFIPRVRLAEERLELPG